MMITVLQGMTQSLQVEAGVEVGLQMLRAQQQWRQQEQQVTPQPSDELARQQKAEQRNEGLKEQHFLV